MTPDAQSKTSSRQLLDLLSRAAIGFGIILTLIYGMTLWNRINIRKHRAGYREERFVVTGAHYSRDEDGEDYFLKGTIAGRDEQLQPSFSRGNEPRGKADLLRAYPPGTEIGVLYNPDVSGTVLNGESARLIQGDRKYLDGESRRFREAVVRTCIPLPTGILIFMIFRYAMRGIPGSDTEPAASQSEKPT